MPLPAHRPDRPHPGFDVLLRPLRDDSQYAPFGTRGEYAPFPTDVAAYYRNPAAYPAHAYRSYAALQPWFVDTAFWSVPTQHKGVSQGNVIEEAIWDLGCVCGLGVYLVRDPAKAVFRWYRRNPLWVYNQSLAWRSPFADGNGSVYLTFQPGTATCFLGDKTKQNLNVYLHPVARKRIFGKSFLTAGLGVPYDGLPRSLSPFGVDEAWHWGDALNDWPAMRNPNMNVPAEHVEGQPAYNHGYDAWEITALRRALGQPFYHRWDRAV